jgi:hypothetical protein
MSRGDFRELLGWYRADPDLRRALMLQTFIDQSNEELTKRRVFGPVPELAPGQPRYMLERRV